MDAIIIKLLETAGIPLAMLIIGWAVGKWFTPWIHKSELRLARAKEIAIVADRITDELLIMFPDSEWDDLLNMTVGRIIQALDVNPEIATREANFQLKKKLVADSLSTISSDIIK